MSKIKVNEEIKKALDRADCLSTYSENVAYKIYHFLQNCLEHSNGMLLQKYLDENNITLADVESAFICGYELDVVIRRGDIVKSKIGGRVVEVSGVGVEKIYFDEDSWWYKEDAEVICKLEDRLDRKEL